MRPCERLKKHVIHTMLSWWNVRSNRLESQRRRARSVSFKKYVDFIMYDKECLIAPPVSVCHHVACTVCMCVCVCVCVCVCDRERERERENMCAHMTKYYVELVCVYFRSWCF